MNNPMLPDMPLSFKLKRIVFVNSASHGYSEIELDNHLALFGNNNAGKTASLAATKLMLYPETDFSKCYEKFKFEGKAGQYSKEDSYDFYFPCNQSFLVMETENDIDTSCVVLYRAGNFKYHRIFLPMAYKDVRHLFWNQNENKFADEISVDALLAFQKANGGLRVTENKQLVQLMYHNFARADSRYCIVPLKSNNKNAVLAFRSIYQMAFDAGKGDTSSLADAIATLVDMKRNRSEEVMSADLASLEATYRDLLKKGSDLQLLTNNKIRYQDIVFSLNELTNDTKALAGNHKALSAKLLEQMNNHASDWQKVIAEVAEANTRYTQAGQQLSAIKDKKNQLAGMIAQTKQAIAANNKYVDIAKEVMAQHKSVVAETLKTTLQEQLADCLDHKTALENIELTAGKLTELMAQQTRDKERLFSCKDLAEDINNLMLNQLPKPVADVLASLNSDLAKVKFNASDEQKKILHDFAMLFNSDAPTLQFLGVPLYDTPIQHYDIEAQATANLAEIKRMDAKLQQQANQISVLHATLKDTSGESQRTHIKAIKAQIDVLNRNIDALGRYDNALIDIEVEKSRLQDYEASIASHNLELVKTETSLNEAATDLQSASDRRSKLSDNMERVNSNKEALERINHALQSYPADTEANDIESLDINLDAKTLRSLVDKADKLTELRNKLKTSINTFIRDVPNLNIDGFQELHTLSDMAFAVDSYSTKFAHLEHDCNYHATKILEHNATLGSQLKEISDAHKMLSDSLGAINKKLASHKISNLKKVSLKLKTSGDFDAVYNLYKSYDITRTELISSDFYQSIIKYMDAHADKRTGLIKIRQIIKSIAFEYEAEDGSTTDKSQSGGTTSTITASVIAILLDDIFVVNSTFKMPIVIDEIGDLDDNNTATIVKCIDSHGFSAFCAKPSMSSAVCLAVGRWVHVDHYQLTCSPMVAACKLNVMPHMVSVWGEQAETLDYSEIAMEVAENDC